MESYTARMRERRVDQEFQILSEQFPGAPVSMEMTEVRILYGSRLVFLFTPLFALRCCINAICIQD